MNIQLSYKMCKCVVRRKTMEHSNNKITKPTIELDDFFEHLDSKIVENIKNTSMESKERISRNIHQYEYDIDGAKKIIDFLK